MNENFLNIAVKAVKKWFYDSLNKGCALSCPVCDKHAQIQARPINRTMAGAIAWMVRNHPPGEWVKMSGNGSPFSKTNQYSTLKHWGLLEQKMNDSDPTKKHVGWWRTTQKGRDFVSGRLAIPRKSVTYNDKLIELQGDLIYISQIIEDFNYADIMAPVHLEGEHSLNG